MATNFAIAQVIKPTELLKLYQYTLLKEPKFGLSAYQYLRSVDDRWNLGGKPLENTQGVTVLYNFSLDRQSWYQPDAYTILISQDYGPPESRIVKYRFKEQVTWDTYIQQMSQMGAVKISTRTISGGQETQYSVKDITFILGDFPPGIHGSDRTYEISIMHVDNK
jgi:hypothetical protein